MKSRRELIHHNLQKYKDLLGAVQLLAVSKRFPLQDIVWAKEWGQTDFGENRVQELVEKSAQLKEVHWHFIGHLQTNKVKMLFKVPGLVALHSVSSLKLLKECLKQSSRLLQPLAFYLQVNTSGEAEKGGFEDFDDLNEAYQFYLQNKTELLDCVGLMTMGTIRTDSPEVAAKKCFQSLRKMRDELNPKLKLSMGMTSDLNVALAEGTDLVRIGTAIFGERS